MMKLLFSYMKFRWRDMIVKTYIELRWFFFSERGDAENFLKLYFGEKKQLLQMSIAVCIVLSVFKYSPLSVFHVQHLA